MRLPEYSLIQGIEVDNDTKFPAGTIIFPFWNEHYIPEHYKQLLKDAQRYSVSKSNTIMCIIGTTWVPVREDNIRKRVFG